MTSQQKPLGFESVGQFDSFTDELAEALETAGLSDAEIGLKGTATTFYSENPSKPLGHHWDADPANPGDLDLNITSKEMVRQLEELGLGTHPTYDVFRMADVESSFNVLGDFTARWEQILGREVNLVGHPRPTARDLTEFVLVDGSGTR